MDRHQPSMHPRDNNSRVKVSPALCISFGTKPSRGDFCWGENVKNEPPQKTVKNAFHDTSCVLLLFVKQPGFCLVNHQKHLYTPLYTVNKWFWGVKKEWGVEQSTLRFIVVQEVKEASIHIKYSNN